MSKALDILVIIPARGGSKGIPRKNLRSLAGRPLIHYSIATAQASSFNPDVFVTSDDEEILAIAGKLGANLICRDPAIAGDATTLDPVIYDAFRQATRLTGKHYSLIITLQPTSPLLSANSLDQALHKMLSHPDIDTIISAKNDTHLTWREEGGAYVPNYSRRVNRQYLPACFTETGGFLITRPTIINESSRIGTHVDLHLLSGGEEIDIDNYEDWNLCEYYLKRRRILFVVTGNLSVGLGHVYNTLLLANDILSHHIEFLVDSQSQLAYDAISSRHYPVFMQQHKDIVDDIKERQPDVVINDRLDTDSCYIQTLKSLGFKIINFEDLGPGARFADLVVNAIYPEEEILPRHYFGHRYFILRDEFFLQNVPTTVRENPSIVLLTFGGVDPNNLTYAVLNAIYDYCCSQNIELRVITGFGYRQHDTLAAFSEIKLIHNTSSIADEMAKADIIFTSAGRTTYEVAALAIPCVVMAQNKREMSHFFASEENGFLHLGLGKEVDKNTLLQRFVHLSENPEIRQYMKELMQQTDLKEGRHRVNQLIRSILEQS